MLKRRAILLLLTVLFGFVAFGQQKKLLAHKMNSTIKMDGLLDEKAWAEAPAATDFIIYYPTPGKPSSEKTVVKILYDETAVYVGAYLYDSNAANIPAQMTARDNEGRAFADNFSVIFDTYNDDQNAFQFLVTTANVQSDVRMSQGGKFSCFGDDYCPNDRNWDAVWDSKTRIVKDGWIVEMKIPFFSLRFAKKDVQSWGLQLGRFMRLKNENSYWSELDPQQNGFIAQFGGLDGLQNLTPPLRLSFLPYVSGGYNSTPGINDVYKNTFLRAGGMDVKYGIDESFTLDMTLVPDFSQVVSDNIIRNVSPFEQQLNENRPFFTEGTELFNKAGLLYSRRIGASPKGFGNIVSKYNNANFNILENPSTTQLINATKISGRNKKNLGLGFFNAITAPTKALVRDNANGKVFEEETSPLTNYNVLVIDQAFKGQSSFTFTNTSVVRNGNERDANVMAANLSLFDSSSTYLLTAGLRWSHTTGADGSNGFRGDLGYAKVSGKWQWSVQTEYRDENYDPNDLGILFRNNLWRSSISLNYYEFKPRQSWLINYNFGFNQTHRRMADGRFQDHVMSTSLFLLFKNFWDVNFILEWMPKFSNDYYEGRRAGKNMQRPDYQFAGFGGSTDSRKKLFGRWFIGFGVSSIRGQDYKPLEIGLRYRFSQRFTLDLSHNHDLDEAQYGYAYQDSLINGSTEPLFAIRRSQSVTNTLTGVYNFTPRLNLSVRLRHYWNSIQNGSFFVTDAEGIRKDIGFVSGLNENFNLFNVDCFLTWDFFLGSRATLAYKRSLTDGFRLNQLSNPTYFKNLGEVLSLPQASEISLRIVWFLDYLHLKKGKFKV
jgi:hypothetical protein